MSIEEECQGYVEHVKGLGVALGASVEACEVIADRGVLGLDQVRFSLGLAMGFDDAVPLEGKAIAGVGVGEDGRDVGADPLGQPVEGDGAVDACVADVMRNNATLSPAISSPYDGSAAFFWTKV